MNALDTIILILAIATVVTVGIFSGRNSNTADEFLLAGKSINKLQAGFSMAATDFGGSGLVAAIGYCYMVGMSGMWWNLAAAPAFLVIGLWLADKFNKMDGATLPEYLGQRYSSAVEYLATVTHVLTNIAALSVQFTVACATLYSITGFSTRISLVISVILVILLTGGGLKSVVNTDAALFVIIVLSVLISVPVMIRNGGGLSSITSQLPGGFTSIASLGFWTPFSWFVLCLLNYSTNQNYIQRMVSAKDEGTARFGACFTAAFYLIISVAIGLIGISSYVLMPGVEDTNTIFPRMLIEFFPHGLIGLGVSGVFAATISTGTSILHATTTLTINDFLKKLAKRENTTDKQTVVISRVLVVVIALLSMILSLFSSNIINVIYIAGLFYGVSVFVPMLMGMYSEKPTAKAALITMITTIGFSLCWQYWLSEKVPYIGSVPANIMGLIISAILLPTISYLESAK